MSDHRSAQAQAYRRLYKTPRWQKLRQWKLSRHPLCQWCENLDRTTAATEVHHDIPHKGDHGRFYDANNLVSLCTPCHNSEAQGIERRGYSNAIGTDGWAIDHKHPANR
jgi:5-methylcytosine-specific restriction protein A